MYCRIKRISRISIDNEDIRRYSYKNENDNILTKMRMTIFFQNEGKDMNIEENSVVELKKELIRHKRKKNHFRY